MELDPTGVLLAVGNIGAGTVSLVSLEEEREVARVDGLFEPHNLTFSPDGSLLYVANLGASHVSVIDVAKAPRSSTRSRLPSRPRLPARKPRAPSFRASSTSPLRRTGASASPRTARPTSWP